MRIQSIVQTDAQAIDRLLNYIPFFRQVRSQDKQQYDFLLSESRLVDVSPGEQLLSSGEFDQRVYFLLKGELEVIVNRSDGLSQVVNTITPGELFGDLSMLLGGPRSANVAVDKNGKPALVFGTNFSLFSNLTDFNSISLLTKLAYYRNVVHNLRWKLEVYRSQQPNSIISSEHRKLRLFTGPQNTEEELHALHEQAKAMAQMLISWNRELSAENLNYAQKEPATFNLLVQELSVGGRGHN
ncbi:cyclic nucleotide-binding domain-containing protein [Marinibactrum halimedae]|uniref:Cyclic nucleotide-binding domain-containing protein n=1 Tax=Marinibactrum halimedae TaxID=1444977 RepID=A0AA37T1F5_9GAMM|nr:cyclic nucleotide-binding domain-containing protein [Marinibactrum halimedae]MCD9459900.1 cyclic nucleotide-binding domain-containing protein [Marinibactrum halimedae]GLS25245.1 hypothetical protein GCM10007877_09590 [Marinibactrum halimedae]